MTKQQAIRILRAAKMSKQRMSKPPSRILVDESKTNSTATPSEEKQKHDVLNNQVVVLTHSYSAKDKEDDLNIESHPRKFSSDERMLTKREQKILPTSWSVLTRKKGLKIKRKNYGKDLVGGKF